jgi:hypothetical protein
MNAANRYVAFYLACIRSVLVSGVADVWYWQSTLPVTLSRMMPPKPRTGLFEHNPIHAGTRFFTVRVKQKAVPEGYEHEGKQKIVKYTVETVHGIVEETQPTYKSPRDTHEHKPMGEFNTLDEAEALADALETEYAECGWHYNSIFVTLASLLNLAISCTTNQLLIRH